LPTIWNIGFVSLFFGLGLLLVSYYSRTIFRKRIIALLFLIGIGLICLAIWDLMVLRLPTPT